MTKTETAPLLVGWYALPNGRHARHEKDGEVWGQLYTENRDTKLGQSGWWRTNDIALAARFADNCVK